MRDERQLEKEKSTEAELQLIARALGEELSARGIPFICLIGSPVGNVIRCSHGMREEVNRASMIKEAVEYINFLGEKYQ
jgi:hypothetical protein